ncbi:unnamed protein product [[Candida] boidinii]|nr:unnamed protein product [[Candida] boidinii]
MVFLVRWQQRMWMDMEHMQYRLVRLVMNIQIMEHLGKFHSCPTNTNHSQDMKQLNSGNRSLVHTNSRGPDVSLTQTEDDGSAVMEEDETATDEAALAEESNEDIIEDGIIVLTPVDKDAEDNRDEATELGTSVDNATDDEADDETAADDEDGHGAQAVPVGSLGNEHSDNGASKKVP